MAKLTEMQNLYSKLLKCLDIKEIPEFEIKTHTEWSTGAPYQHGYESETYTTEAGEYRITYNYDNSASGIKRNNAKESVCVNPPRSHRHLVQLSNTSLDDVLKQCAEIKAAIDKDAKSKVKTRIRREENRPVDELTIIAKAMDEVGIPYKRYGTQLKFDLAFQMIIEMDRHHGTNDKGIFLKFGSISGYWYKCVIGDLTNPDSKLLDNIIQLAKHAHGLDMIANKITTNAQ